MPDRYRVTPRTHTPVAAYGHVWPGAGSVVTTDEVGADTLQRLDGDARFTVAEEGLVDASPKPPDPKPSPKPRRRS